MATIKGVWVFNEFVNHSFNFDDPTISFISNDIEFMGMLVKGGSSGCDITYYNQISGISRTVCDIEWYDDTYRILDFGTAGISVADDFYNWFTANATQQVEDEEVPPHLISLTKNNETIYLATAGKYCDRNIAVTANIDEQPIREEGIALGETVGRQAAYDEFWDAYQDSGNRTNYSDAFRGLGWNDATYNPSYLPKPVTAASMYNSSNIIERKVLVDTSNCTAMDSMFGVSKIKSVGTIDTRNIGNLAGVFGYMSNLENIDLLILKEDGSQTFTDSCFAGDAKLKELRMQGKIGTSLNMSHCYALSGESLTSIISALSDEVSGKTLTLSTFVKKYLTDEEWSALTGTKQNWTISFV